MEDDNDAWVEIAPERRIEELEIALENVLELFDCEAAGVAIEVVIDGETMLGTLPAISEDVIMRAADLLY